MLNGPSGDRAGTRVSTNPMARKRRPPGRQAIADYFSSLCTIILRSFPPIVPARPLRAVIQLEEAETARNSLSWTILQGTPLF